MAAARPSAPMGGFGGAPAPLGGFGGAPASSGFGGAPAGSGFGGAGDMDLFSLGTTAAPYVAPTQILLTAAKAKGLELSTSFSRKGGSIFMDMSFSNKAMMVSFRHIQ